MANNIIKRVWNQNETVRIEDLRGMVFQYESDGHTFIVSGVNTSGEPFDLTGRVDAVFLRPDFTDVAITGSISGGIISVTLPAECYEVPGRFILTIFLISGEQKTAVYAAVGSVSRTSSGIVSPEVTENVTDLIDRIADAVDSIPASWTGLMADIAPVYSNSSHYAVGDYCYYNGDLYRCTVAITTPETFDDRHWQTAVISKGINNIVTYSEMQRMLDASFISGKLEGAILSVANVTKARVIYNYTGKTDDDGIPAHSVCCVFAGGNALAVATVIKSLLPDGVSTYGVLSQTVDGEVIKETRVTHVSPTVTITLSPGTGYDESVANAIKAYVMQYINAQDIGQDLVISDLKEAVGGISNTFTLSQVSVTISDTTYTGSDVYECPNYYYNLRITSDSAITITEN